MEKVSNTDLSESSTSSSVSEHPAFASLRWQHNRPGSLDASWPRSQPDLLSIPPDQLKQLMLQARKYDPRAIESFARLAIPIAKHYSSLPKVVSVLGKEEACSIANHTMMNFLMHERLQEGRQDIPTMLKRAIRCDLMNQMDRIRNRSRFETHGKPSDSQSEDDDEDSDVTANLPADKRLEPEQMALLAEQKRLVRECLQYLSPKEKRVINGFFYRQLSVAEIAAELHCPVATVSAAKCTALQKLRKLFKEKHIA